MQHAHVNKLIKDSKIEYFRDRLDSADAKTMYNTLNSLLNSSVQKLPSCNSNVALSNTFAQYFTNKVPNIRSELDDNIVCSISSAITTCNESIDTSVCNNDSYENSKCTDVMHEFTIVNEEEVRKIMSKLPNKTSPLDPIPTWLMNEKVR